MSSTYRLGLYYVDDRPYRMPYMCEICVLFRVCDIFNLSFYDRRVRLSHYRVMLSDIHDMLIIGDDALR